PVPGEWSAFHVLRHMRDAALVYSIRFRWMAFNADPFLPDYDEDRWVALAADTAADLPALLGEFAASRSGLVRLLTRLSPEAWGSTGRHEVLGTVVLEPYVRHQLKHEELHLEQLWAALALAAASSR
ncbi:MAG: DinB family protein, partial [Dehalococcoidia bacterium]